MQGFHRIEALIFRNKDLKAALRFAEDLIKDSEALIEALNDPNNFSAAGSFSGMIGLSTEVGAKKMSSEEETYSDLSILIFHNNYLGVESQYRPFASIVKDKDPKLAADMDAALSAWLAAIAPFAEEGENGSFTYTPYSKVTVSQRRDIQAGAYQVAKLLQKSADALGIVFPEEEENDEACEDTPEVVFPGDSDEIAAGLDYFRALMPFQEALAENLLAAIKGGKLAKAKEAYVKSRPLYEQIEVLAASFPQEDSDLDARPYAFGLGEFDPEFKGFHKLERQIYRDEDLGEGTIETAEGLIASLKALTKKLDTPELFGSVENFEGIIGLATEVPAKKISSEEETFSLLSHLIYYNNWKGIYSQIKSFVDAVEDKEKFSGLEEAFAKAFTCLPVETEDVWKKVSAEDVTQDFVDALTNADYKEYDLTDLEARECIIINGYKIRDLVLELSQELKVFANCHPFHSSSVFSYRHSVF